ncbi:Ger(x)C family spore germination protein [Paenibacillus sepulcri]|uniref:Ger(X)C family spore germination protein n=1 Tax=Paenibacillus sepulcri TaxID=359917 RepID=A0ABS7C257_9BACL|nr:Ger(x)C family spore germination protein [Paenibacillus sepulcri]
MNASAAYGLFRVQRVRIMAVVLCLLLLTPLISGCWDVRYLDRIGVVFAIGVDDDPTGKHKLLLSVQVVLPQNVSGGSSRGSSAQGPAVITFRESADTMFEGLRHMGTMTSRRLYFSHTQLFVIGDAIARQGFWPLLDFVDRNPEVRTNIQMLVARGTRAEQLLKTTTLMEPIPVQQIHSMVETTQKSWPQSYKVTAQELIRDAVDDMKQSTMPSILLVGNKSSGNDSKNVEKIKPDVIPKLSTMAIFRSGELIGYLNQQQSLGLGWIMNKVNDTIVKVPCFDNDKSQGEVTIEIQSAVTKLSVRRSKKSAYPEIMISVKTKGIISEITCRDLNVIDETTFELFQAKGEKKITAEIEAAIKQIQGVFHTDTFGWSTVIYKGMPQTWKKLKPRWDDEFVHIPHQLKVDVKIGGTGLRGKSIVK